MKPITVTCSNKIRSDVIYSTEDLRIKAVNFSFVKHYQYTKEEALSLRISDLHPKAENDHLINLISKLKGTAHNNTFHHVKKDGTVFSVETYSHEYFRE